MGLHAVSGFLKSKFPSLYHKEHISLFAHQRIFLDIAGFLVRYIAINGTEDNRWINGMIGLSTTLIRNGVLPFFVFDGQAPKAKAEEQQERRAKRKERLDRANALLDAVESYRKNCATDEQLALLYKESSSIVAKQSSSKVPNLLARSKQQTVTMNVTSDSKFDNCVLEELNKNARTWKIQSSSLKEEDYKFLKQLFTACGVGWIQAPGESESYCCWLVRNDFGTAVASHDTDCIAYRADIIITDIDGRSGDITFMNLQELLDAFELDVNQLVDFGILVGCDYNTDSRVNQIGPTTAIKLLQKHGNIDQFPKDRLKDVNILKHVMIRELFQPVYNVDDVALTAPIPDVNLLKQLVQQRKDVNITACMRLIDLVNRKPQPVYIPDPTQVSCKMSLDEQQVDSDDLQPIDPTNDYEEEG